METQTTQPENPPETPKMIEKITLPKKEKNPGRVAAGKRLADWNRQRKLEKLQAQATETQVPELVTTTPASYDKCYLFLGVVGVALSVIGLYYSRHNIHVCPPKKVKKEPLVENSAPNAVYKME